MMLFYILRFLLPEIQKMILSRLRGTKNVLIINYTRICAAVGQLVQCLRATRVICAEK